MLTNETITVLGNVSVLGVRTVNDYILTGGFDGCLTVFRYEEGQVKFNVLAVKNVKNKVKSAYCMSIGWKGWERTSDSHIYRFHSI